MKTKTRKPRGKAFFCVRCLRTHHPAVRPEGSYLGLNNTDKKAWDAAVGFQYHRQYTDGTERGEAIKRLRESIKPGMVLYTVLRRRSSSGMTRHISILGIDRAFVHENGEPRIFDFTWNAAKALDYRMNRDTGGLVVGGCGMDMGFHVVYNLSRVLFDDAGFKCIGRKCPSNDHSNGDRSYRRGRPHSDGGYALRQRWL